MSWENEAEEIALRRELSRQQGGEEGIACSTPKVD